MSEGGKQSFAQFAADQNFPGVELDNTRRWNSGFKKVAVSPEHHRRRGTSTPPEVASERYLKAPRRGENLWREKSQRGGPTTPKQDPRVLAIPPLLGQLVNDQISPLRDRKGTRRNQRDMTLGIEGEKAIARTSMSREVSLAGRRRRRAKVERTPTPSSSYSDDLASEDPLHPESNSREGKSLEDEVFHPSKMAPGFKQGIFAKAAVEPPFGSSGSPEVEPLGESAPSKFQKRAGSPVLPRDAITPFKPADPVKPIGGGAAKSGEEKEKRLMDDFDLRCLSIYTQFLERNVEMEITEILRHLGGGEDSSEWGAAFASLTRPKRAATGLRYIRLLENYVNWLKRESGDKSQTLDPIGKEVVWHYLHHLAKEEVGAHTPKSFLLALRFLGEALGFCLEAFSYQRNKKLIETHFQSPQAEKQGPYDPDQDFGVSWVLCGGPHTPRWL